MNTNTNISIEKEPVHILDKDNNYIFGIIGVILTVGFYNAFFAFSFLPLTEGWFSTYANLIIDGKMPYRDFYLHMTPLYPMALSAVIALFGESFFVLRIFGVFIIISIAVLLYLILSVRFSATSSMFASIVACIYYQSGVAHIPYDFTQVLTLFTLASAYMLVLACYETQSIDNFYWLSPAVRHMLCSGLFASLSFLTKQSNGAFVVLAAWCCCFYISLPFKRLGWKLILAFGIGCLIPVLITIIWLLKADALQPFWEQIFVGAIAAKGSLGHILFSWLNGLLTSVYVIQLISVGKWCFQVIIGSLILKIFLSFIDKPLTNHYGNRLLMFSLFILGVMVITISYMDFPNLTVEVKDFGSKTINYIIPVTTFISAILLIYEGIRILVPALKKHQPSPSIVIICIISAGMIWGNGTSAGLSEIGVFAMLAIIIAGMMDLSLFRYVGFSTAIALAISLIFTFSSNKFEAPYAWWGVAEPSVHEAHFFSKSPIAHGLKLSNDTAQNFDILTDSLTNRAAGDDIFAFPNIPVVYLIARHWPHSKVVIPWFDFLPDEPAKTEAARLLNSPPDTIVNLKLPPVAWDAHEQLFRNGKPLGQRNIQIAIETLTKRQSQYHLNFAREVSPGCILEVWHHKGRNTQKSASFFYDKQFPKH